MDTILSTLNGTLPILGVILLLVGIKLHRIKYLITGLWISLMALVLHYQTAGGVILGSYFGYKNAAVYTLNLLVLITTLIYLFLKHPVLHGKLLRNIAGFISTCIVAGSICLIINLWVNAQFIESRRPGTRILQVATFTPLPYCTYRYIFYKVGINGNISYMCPNYYRIIPSIGTLDRPPEFVINLIAQQSIKTENVIENKKLPTFFEL